LVGLRLERIVIAAALLMVATALVRDSAGQGRPFLPSITVNGHEAVAGEALVKFARDAAAALPDQLAGQLDADENEPIGANLRRFRSRTLSVEALITQLRSQRGVEYAEPNYILRVIGIPNDPDFPNLWGLNNTGQVIGGQGVVGADIHALSAWSVSTGSRANVVAVVDTGVDYTHQDLAANIWNAPAAFTVTIGGASITCAAGTHGFNAITKTCDPMDDNNHGSHVSGTIGGAGNNGIGVTGVAWTANMMALKFLDATGAGTTANAINAIEFGIQAKSAFASNAAANVRVLSNSWGGSAFSQALLDEINKAAASEMLFVAAAGNNASNNDVSPQFPASYNASNIIAVAASDNTDRLASFSNFGNSVHVAAPGVNIQSTTIGNTYQYFSGTSMATPHVSGTAALILSACALDTAHLKAAILTNVDVLPALNGLVATSGRLDANKAVRSCTRPLPPTGVRIVK
jgi:subtilisin family serine protease